MDVFGTGLEAFAGSNPTQMYSEMLQEVLAKGKECTPRGKKIKELSPVLIQFLNPLDRVTFLRGRRINPFFQLAEALWIVSGRSDVEFLAAFNENMRSFSDDGKFFNASYGERIRYFTKNDLHRQVLNPIDQLEDAYLKLKADPDTRQATIVISNPLFDNYNYTVKEQGKDIACNLVITFKLREGKLNMMVRNRSNDLHWGLFGANLCQFSTIQELMASWLGVEVGWYAHDTDSLHVYVDDYGYKITNQVLEAEKKAFGEFPEWAPEHEYPTWKFDQEPRMAMDYETFDHFLGYFWGAVAGNIISDHIYTQGNPLDIFEFLNVRSDFISGLDPYWAMTVNAMIAYRLIKLEYWQEALHVIGAAIPASTWKASMLYFVHSMLVNRLNKAEDSEVEHKFQELLKQHYELCDELTEHLSGSAEDKAGLLSYLTEVG